MGTDPCEARALSIAGATAGGTDSMSTLAKGVAVLLIISLDPRRLSNTKRVDSGIFEREDGRTVAELADDDDLDLVELR